MCWTGEKTSKKATASDVVSQIKSFRADTGQKCLRLTKRPYLLILANIQSNKRQKKETLRFSDQYFSYMLLSKRKIFHFNRKSQNLFTFQLQSWIKCADLTVENVHIHSHFTSNFFCFAFYV